jgi:dihydrofolate reductase
MLHEWVLGLASFRERHGTAGGVVNTDDGIVAESVRSTGAVVMGRRMYSGGEGAWEDDPRADGWWGEDPPFRVPVFILTHHRRPPVEKQGGTTFTFVTDGIEAALEQARAAAGTGDVLIAGGAEIVQQYLTAGLVDDVQIHLAPVLLGGGTRLFAADGAGPARLEAVRVVASDAVTHLRFRPLARRRQEAAEASSVQPGA